ncbi:hypothetical protein [Actinopolymorpha pittospori]
MAIRERTAHPGEVCTCGRPALVVLTGTKWGPIGWCGLSDGGDLKGPCPFCGGPRHDLGRCPHYELRPDWAQPPK